MSWLVNLQIDFLKYRRFWVTFSVAVMLLGVVGFFYHGQLQIGIEFAGGTQLTVKTQDNLNAGTLRDLLAKQQIAAQIQQYGTNEEHSFLIKVTTSKSQADEGDRVVAALDASLNQSGQRLDLNRCGSATLAQTLAALDPDRLTTPEKPSPYRDVAAAVLAERRQVGLFSSWDQVATTPGLSTAALAALRDKSALGAFTVLGVETISGQIGKELSERGLLAVVMALLGMLIYIGFRFDLPYGFGAIIASLHDVLVVLALFIILQFEFNLTTIAGLLTLVGYSVNDTVVVFDRVRENLRLNPRRSLLDTMNLSLNQTLSRTLLTSGTTLLAAGSLLAFGGEALRGFSFIMTLGVVVGTYSSIYIACPFALLWYQRFGTGRKLWRRGGPTKGAMPPSSPKPSSTRVAAREKLDAGTSAVATETSP